MEKITQLQNIQNHLEQHKSITAMDALNLYGCFRLAARISDLRNLGLNIKTNMITVNGATFASYEVE